MQREMDEGTTDPGAEHARYVRSLYAGLKRARARGEWDTWMEYATETGDAALWPEILQVYRDYPQTRWSALWHVRCYWLAHPELIIPLVREAFQEPKLRDVALETAAELPEMADDVVHWLTTAGPQTWYHLGKLLSTLACQFGLIRSHFLFDQSGWDRHDPLVRHLAAELQQRYGIDLDGLIPVVEIRRKGGELLLRKDGHSLEGHWLNDMDLRRADLAGAKLGVAFLWGADLREADLQDADLDGATLTRARLGSACLRGASLRNADLAFTDLEDADLRDAVLESADLRSAQLLRTDLRGADLRDACLRDATLARVDLRGADLRGATLAESILQGTNLGEAQLADADLNSLLYDSDTKWPAGFDPQKQGAVLVR